MVYYFSSKFLVGGISLGFTFPLSIIISALEQKCLDLFTVNMIWLKTSLLLFIFYLSNLYLVLCFVLPFFGFLKFPFIFQYLSLHCLCLNFRVYFQEIRLFMYSIESLGKYNSIWILVYRSKSVYSYYKKMAEVKDGIWYLWYLDLKHKN